MATRANWELALICGNRRVNLMSDPASGGWTLLEGGASLTPGSLQAAFEAGERVASERANAVFELQFAVRSSTGLAELQRNIHDVYRFVVDTKQRHEQSAIDAVYLVVRMDEGYSGTGNNVMLFGRGLAYYEVLTIEDIAFENAFSIQIAKATNPVLPSARMRIVCKPNSVSKPFFLGQATGWVRPTIDGDLEIFGSGSNVLLNPILGNSTSGNDFAAEDAELVPTNEYEHVRTGFRAMRLTNTSGSVSKFWASTKTLAASTYALSSYVYKDSTAPTASDLVLWGQGASLVTGFLADDVYQGWYRASASFTGIASACTHGLLLKAAKSVIVGDLQLEINKAYATPFMVEGHNIGPGVAWDGTAHNSAQTRTKGQYRLPVSWAAQSGYENIFPTKGAIGIWVKAPWIFTDSVTRYILAAGQSATQNAILLYKGTSGPFHVLTFDMYGSTSGGHKAISMTTTVDEWPTNSWVFLVCTWNVTGPTGFYQYDSDGDLVQYSNTTSDTGIWTAPNQLGNYIYLGTDLSAANPLDGWIADLRIFGPDATVTPASLAKAGRGKSYLPGLWTKTIGGTVQSAYDGTNDNTFWIFNVPGDEEAKLRLFIHNNSSWENIYLGLNTFTNFPYTVNSYEIANIYYYTSGAASPTMITDGSRSGSSYARKAISSACTYLSANILMDDGRLAPYITGRYRMFMVARDNATGTGLVRFQTGLAQDTPASGIGVYSRHSGYPFSDYFSIDKVGYWGVADAGTFDFPPVQAPKRFLTETQSSPLTANFLSFLALTSNSTLSASCNVELDNLVFMPEIGTIYIDSLATNKIAVIDGMNHGIAHYSHEGAGDTLAMEPTSFLDYDGRLPALPPHRWIFGNVLMDRTSTSSQTPADSVILNGIIQVSNLWGN